jgi:hypothetical protein
MAAKILQFVSRNEQVRRRGIDSYSRWKRITKGFEPFGPAEGSRLFRRQAEDEAKDRSWVQRHHPLGAPALVLPFTARAGGRRPQLKDEFARMGLT